MADISVGVIGTGRTGSCHAVNVHRSVKGARVAAIYDLDQARARQVAAECGSARAFQDPVQLIQDVGVRHGYSDVALQKWGAGAGLCLGHRLRKGLRG